MYMYVYPLFVNVDEDDYEGLMRRLEKIRMNMKKIVIKGREVI